jgi:hypothetical protein
VMNIVVTPPEDRQGLDTRPPRDLLREKGTI